MRKPKDLVGKTYGRLTVISRNIDKQMEVYEKKHRNIVFWNCHCSCGKDIIVATGNLENKSNPTRSCGCLKEQSLHKQKNTKNIEWNFDNGFITGITLNGDKFYIDNEDYETVKDYCWRVNKHGYVVVNKRDGSNKIINLHRLVMGLNDEDILVDHKNWDKLDNRKSNLRIATKSQNNINIKRKSNNTSGYTGVHYNKKIGKYTARISKNGKRLFLGNFNTLEDAIKVRHKAEINLHGEWSGEINRKDYIKS